MSASVQVVLILGFGALSYPVDQVGGSGTVRAGPAAALRLAFVLLSGPCTDELSGKGPLWSTRVTGPSLALLHALIHVTYPPRPLGVSIISLVLQRRKGRHKETKQFAQGHPVSVGGRI